MKLVYVIIICLPIWSWAADRVVDVARFSQGDMNSWQTKVFAGETYYSLQSLDGQIALRADSSATGTATAWYGDSGLIINKGLRKLITY